MLYSKVLANNPIKNWHLESLIQMRELTWPETVLSFSQPIWWNDAEVSQIKTYETWC